MEVSEAIKAKLKLQKDMYELIQAFERNTCLTVYDVVITKTCIGFDENVISNLEVKLDLGVGYKTHY